MAMSVIVGLGNPGPEYVHHRHNTGRLVVQALASSGQFPDWRTDKKLNALITKQGTVTLVLPETFMNRSGTALTSLVKNQKAAERLIVVYDDLDLPFGTFKISFNRGSGGHKGIESIARALKTKAFVRVRVGVSPTTPSGKIKKPIGEQKVHDFLLSDYKPAELTILKKLSKKIIAALECLVSEGRERAMNQFN